MGIWENIFKQNTEEEKKEDIEKSSEATDEFLGSLNSLQEKILLENEITKRKKLSGGTGDIELIRIKKNGKAIMKKSYFEKDPTIEPNRERAAYIVDRFFGFNVVPTTIVKGEGEDTRSVQEFIENAKTFEEIGSSKSGEIKKILKEHREDIMKVMILDLFIGNIDRRFPNWIIADENIYAIDHGLSFMRLDTYNSVWMSFPYLFAEYPVPQNLLNNFREFIRQAEAIESLRELLQELLPENTVSLYIERMKNIIKSIDEDGFISKEVLEKYSDFPQ